jgi:hypothetical protein
MNFSHTFKPMRIFLFTLAILMSIQLAGQTIAGSWYGKADILLSGQHNNYLTELIIKQKGNEIEGIFGYYFKNGYQSVFVRGKYDKKNHVLEINDLPITYFREASIDGVNCYMDFVGTMIASQVRTTMNGYFMTNPKYRYTCPELKVTYTLDTTEEKRQDDIIKTSVSRKLWQPMPQDVVINSAPLVPDTSVTVAVAAAAEVKPEIKSEATPLPEEKKAQELMVSFEKRENIISKEIEVGSDSVRISLYDNGDVDGDTISIFLNKIPVLSGQEITSQALNIYVHLDSKKAINEITMYADNLGKIPPNTALMVVNDGEIRHEIYLSSSLTQNATVRIKRKKR